MKEEKPVGALLLVAVVTVTIIAMWVGVFSLFLSRG